MKHLTRLPLLLVICLSLLVLTGCMSFSSEQDGLVVGNDYRLTSGQTINHDLTLIGSTAVLEDGSTVNGEVAIIGGNVTIDGQVNGNVSVVGGTLSLDDHAQVMGDLSQVSSTLQKSKTAVIQGKEIEGKNPSITMVKTPPLQINFDPIGGTLTAIFQAIALAALAILANLFAAQLMHRVGHAALIQPLMSGGVGLLTVIVAPALLVLLAITIILIPVSLIGLLGLGIAALFGWLSLSLVAGRQIAIWLKQTWSEPVMAGVGALVLSLVTSMLNIIPCLGWIPSILLWLVGLGAVLLTRFGTQNYTPLTTSSMMPGSSSTVPPVIRNDQ
jgi:hypothetical protein